jgi:hypothetical protein
MDRWSSVRWLGGFVASVLLLSGCAVEAIPDDGVSWILEVEEKLEMGPQGRPDWAGGEETWEDDAETDSNEGSSQDTEETADPIEPLTPDRDISQEREDGVNPSDGASIEAEVWKLDPHPEPRIPVKRR